MNKLNADIDIDVNDRRELLKHVPCICARNKDGSRHVTGVYFQKIRFNENTNVATIKSDEAQEQGYFKVDFLNLSIYDLISSNEQLLDLLDQDTDWSLLKDRGIVERLLHVSKYYNQLQLFRIKSIDDMAVFLAIIRPAKKHLLNKDREYIDKHIWDKPDADEYYYKKSHAYSYAMVIKLQLNLITYEDKYSTVLKLIGGNTK